MENTKKLKQIIRAWVPAVVWMVTIFLFSNRQRIAVSTDYYLNFLFFKSLHVIEYGILWLFDYRAFRIMGETKKSGIFAFFCVVFYAATDEFHQAFVPSREGRIRDVIIDTIGALISWILLVNFLPKLPKKLKNWAYKLGMN